MREYYASVQGIWSNLFNVLCCWCMKFNQIKNETKTLKCEFLKSMHNILNNEQQRHFHFIDENVLAPCLAVRFMVMVHKNEWGLIFLIRIQYIMKSDSDRLA